MKKLVIFCLAVIGFIGVKAQEGAFIPINYKALEKKIQTSNAEIVDPKKSIDPKTWVKRGEIMLSANEIDLEQVLEGMTPNNLSIFYPNPSIGKETFEGKNYDTYTYPRIKFYFDNGALSMWTKTKWIYDKPLNEAYKSFMKAFELDAKKKYTSKITDDLNELKSQLRKFGINEYYLGNKEGALEAFELVLDINKTSLMKDIKDTILIQYSGIIARELNLTERAIDHYKDLAKIDHSPNTYLLIKEDYLKLKDTVNAIQIMKEAFAKYPDTLNIVASLVDLYIRNNKIEEGLKTINTSLEKNPNKGEFYYWKGRLILNTNSDDHIDKALEAYNKAIEVSPNLYYVYYDIGYIYFLEGQDLFNRSGEEKDKKYREEMVSAGTDFYKKALPNLEKALELNTSNRDIKKETLDTLKRLYYKLQMNDKYDEATEMLKHI